jgi:transmembrane sensor
MHYSERQLKQAVTWFVRLQSERCSEQDQQLFNAWLAKEPAHRAAYTKAEQLWGTMDNLKTLDDIPALTKARNTRPEKVRLSTIVSLLFMMMLFGAAYTEYSAETLTYATVQGERRHIVLADNSQIDLNTNTQLHVKISLLKRQVQLVQGEALFTVSHESLRNFTVQADTLRIRDIGTRFNVHLEPESMAVAVLEGEVELDDGQSVNHQSLLAGNQRIYTKNTGLSQSEVINSDTVTAWLNGHLVFKRSSLRQVTAELERYHAVKFVFVHPELAQETLSGTFEANNLEPFLHAIETLLPIRAKHQGKTILLQRAQKK